ncbi:MAG: L,D-transpeptidase family protein [Xanthobacteraceae bacterium]
MTATGDRAARLSRRSILAGTASLAASAASAQPDTLLQLLIRQNGQADYGHDFDSTSRTILMPKASLPTLSPATVQTSERAIAQYQAIAARGGWPVVPPVERLRVGNRHPSVTALRRRLVAVGDLDASAGATDIFDSYVEAAVRRFQARHGISLDGVMREHSFKAMNVPVDVRLAQLKVNLTRLRGLTRNTGGRFVMCNIPAAQIEAIENGVAVSRHTGVVGKPDRPSPEISSRITEINFNPFWTVPVSIVKRDLIPKMQSEPEYLTKNHIRIFDQRNREVQPTDINWNSDEAINYRFKQDPGDFNSLGSIRINFPNTHQVYMHDTPFKNLFGEDFRFHSSGCVRVQNVRELVYWLLRETPGWPRVEVDRVVKVGERRDVKLKRPIPLYWVYVTAWASADGVVQFRDDIYGRDGLGPSVNAAPG